jgi:hypothetical protein
MNKSFLVTHRRRESHLLHGGVASVAHGEPLHLDAQTVALRLAEGGDRPELVAARHRRPCAQVPACRVVHDAQELAAHVALLCLVAEAVYRQALFAPIRGMPLPAAHLQLGATICYEDAYGSTMIQVLPIADAVTEFFDVHYPRDANGSV